MKVNPNHSRSINIMPAQPLFLGTKLHSHYQVSTPSRPTRRGYPALEETSSFERGDPPHAVAFPPVFCDVKEGGGPPKRLKSIVQKSPAFFSSRTVTFHHEVMVLEFDRVDDQDANDVWWRQHEMEGFRYDATITKCKYRRFGLKKSSRTRNHTRRIIFQQNASAEMDGMSDPKYLAMFSLESSKKSKEVAILSALKMEKEVEGELCLHSKISNTVCFGQNRWMADYYLGTVFDTLSDTVSCGALIP
jgi:hypothetical protein